METLPLSQMCYCRSCYFLLPCHNNLNTEKVFFYCCCRTMWMESISICLNYQVVQIAISILKSLFWQDTVVKIFLTFAKVGTTWFLWEDMFTQRSFEVFLYACGAFSSAVNLESLTAPKVCRGFLCQFFGRKIIFSSVIRNNNYLIKRSTHLVVLKQKN